MLLHEVAPSNTVLYHVTFTKNVPAILKKGITHFNPTNWVKAGSKERYGEGDIYAFESQRDANRWAAKADWEFNTTMGSGKMSIVSFRANLKEWKQDTADPLGQSSAEGRWLKSHVTVKPEEIVSHYPLTPDVLKPLVRN